MKSVITLLFVPLLSWAHGENKPGPHGGYIQMPGAFHTEVVPDKEQSFMVYLLDINFQNPTVKNSKVEAFVQSKDGKTNFSCNTMAENHFYCVPNQKYSTPGKLIIKAMRENASANEAVYVLPLAPFKDAEKKDSGHHHH